MTTLPRERHTIGPLLLICLLILVAAMVLPGLGEIVVGTHAESRHGDDAWAAIRAAEACGARCLYECPGGDKWYSVGRIGDRFFLVVGYSSRVATAFISSHDLSYRPREEGCVANWAKAAGHDGLGPGMAY